MRCHLYLETNVFAEVRISFSRYLYLLKLTIDVWFLSQLMEGYDHTSTCLRWVNTQILVVIVVT